MRHSIWTSRWIYNMCNVNRKACSVHSAFCLSESAARIVSNVQTFRVENGSMDKYAIHCTLNVRHGTCLNRLKCGQTKHCVDESFVCVLFLFDRLSSKCSWATERTTERLTERTTEREKETECGVNDANGVKHCRWVCEKHIKRVPSRERVHRQIFIQLKFDIVLSTIIRQHQIQCMACIACSGNDFKLKNNKKCNKMRYSAAQYKFEQDLSSECNAFVGTTNNFRCSHLECVKGGQLRWSLRIVFDCHAASMI